MHFFCNSKTRPFLTDLNQQFMEAALTNSKHLGKSPFIYCYELGNCYCMKLDWKKAIEIWTPLCDEEKFQVKNLEKSNF